MRVLLRIVIHPSIHLFVQKNIHTSMTEIVW